MATLRKIFWLLAFLVLTFVFVVLFEHGPTNLRENLKAQAEESVAVLKEKIDLFKK